MRFHGVRSGRRAGPPPASLLAAFLVAFPGSGLGVQPSAPADARQVEAQRMVLEVRVNGVDRGEVFVEVTADGDVLLTPESFRRLQLHRLEELVDLQRPRVSLRSLSESLSYRIDEVELVLEITVRPELLGETVINAYARPEGGEYLDSDSLFLNYGLTYGLEEGAARGSWDVAGELGARVQRFLATSTFAYRRNPVEERLVRLRTSVTRDFRDSLRSLTVGDFQAFSGTLGSALSLGGIAISKNFDIDPYFISFPTYELRGSALTPSEIEVYRNGQLLMRERVPAGEFLLDDLPPTLLGENQFEVVLRDAFGRERSLSAPFYFDSRLLGAGLHRYSYGIGFRRRSLGLESFDYGKAVFAGFHEIGVSRGLEVEFAGEVSPDGGSGSGGLAVLLGRAGTLQGLVGVSRNDGGDWGGALSVTHSVFGRVFTSSVAAQLFSPAFQTVGSTPGATLPQLNLDGRFRVNLGELGSVSALLSHFEARGRGDRRRYALTFNRPLMRRGNLFVTAVRSEDELVERSGVRVDDELLVGLHFYIGRGVAASSTHTWDDTGVRQSLRLQKNPPLHRGIGYRVSVDNGFAAAGGFADRGTEGSGSFQYNGAAGTYTAELRRFAGRTTGSVSATGGIVILGRSVGLTRPVTESFALVRVPGVEGVEVRFNNQVVGRTDEAGELLVPNLLPYHVNRIDIEGDDIPLEYNVDTLSRFVITPLKGGGIVDFAARRIRAVHGILTDADGEPLTNAFVELSSEGGPVRTRTGRDGEFYLENLQPRSYRLVLTGAGRTHECSLVVPESAEILLDLGEVNCQPIER